MKLRLALAIGAVIVPLSLMAQEPQERPWSGKATLGYLATSGNTENSTLNTGVEIGYKVGNWQHTAIAKAINAAEEDETTAEAYEFGWKSERNLTDKDFLFGKVEWRKDRFGGFDTQLSEVVGYGRRLIKTDKHMLNAEIGAGARQSERRDGTEENESVVNGGLNYTWILSETALFSQELATEVGADNAYSESITKLSARLLGNLALVASYTIKHNSDVPVGTEKRDTYSALSLEYAF